MKLEKRIIYPILIAVLVLLNAIIAVQLYRIYRAEQKAPQTFEERQLYFYLDEIKKDPRNIEARVNLVLTLIQLKRLDEAEAELKKAQQLNEKDPRVLFAAAVLEKEKGNIEASIEYHKKAVELDPGNANSRLELAKIYIESKKYDEAIKLLEETKKIVPMAADVYYLLGLCYKGTGETTKAKENLMKALQFAPDFKEARKELAELGN